MRRYLTISLVLLLSLTGCSLKMTRGLTAVGPQVASVKNPYFSSLTTDYVYKMTIDVYGRNMGGILVIKKVADRHYRLAMMTEFGSTLLDLELLNGRFTTHTISDELNRKVVLKTLKNDFRLMLQQTFIPTAEYEEDGGILYKTSGKKGYVIVRNDIDGQLYEIIQTGKVKEKVIITFMEKRASVVSWISIDHLNRKLTISLKKI